MARQAGPQAWASDLTVTSTELRSTVGEFATGITVVTALDDERRPHGVTATSFAPLSLEPPLVQWSLRNVAWSHRIFSAAAVFAINVLTTEQEAVSRLFSSPVRDRFAELETTAGIDGVPLIQHAAAWIECSLEDTLPGGDHTIMVGRVLRTRTFGKEPLLHWRGKYARMYAPRIADAPDQTK